MTREDFTKVIESEAAHCCNLLSAKGKEYDADEKDRLNSFKRAGSLMNEDQIKALAGMMAKHSVSVYDMCTRGKCTDYPIEKWEEKIDDSINYLLILWAMVKEEQNGAKQAECHDADAREDR
jgi:hypothetical protein